MKPHPIKRVVLVVLPIIAALSLTLLFAVHSSSAASAHTLQPRIPHSGCCAVIYTHIATVANTTANWTELDNKDTNGNPNAFVIVTPNRSSSPNDIVDTHPVGVWYDGIAGKWAIFNQDRTAMPVGAAFNVYALQAFLPGNQSAAVLLIANVSNIAGNWIYIDNPITNNNPNAFVNVTLNWNPDDIGGVYDAHPLGTWYNTTAKKWAIFNEGSMDPIPTGASFNLLLDTSIVVGTLLQTATTNNTSGNHTTIDNAATNNRAGAIVFATSNFNPQGHVGIYDNYTIGVYYHNGKWSIFNINGADMPVGAAFDVLAE